MFSKQLTERHMNFGYILRTLRISAGVSLRELSRMIDVSPTYMSFVETGKEPPPCPARVARIEEALKVPQGYLMSLVNRADRGLSQSHAPEVVDFLSMAKRCSMCAGDFMELTEYLNRYGWETIRETLKNGGLEPFEIEPPRQEIVGPYLWPFLEEKLIFDLIGVENKRDLLERAVGLMAQGREGMRTGPLLAELLKREAAASTGIGGGVAVPHAFVPGLKKMVVALFRILDGMDFESIDGEPVYMVLVMAGPHSSENVHLRLLARIAKLVRYDSFIESVLRATSPREVISMFRSAEMRIP